MSVSKRLYEEIAEREAMQAVEMQEFINEHLFNQYFNLEDNEAVENNSDSE